MDWSNYIGGKYMTLIAALKESDDSVLIASDSAITEYPGGILTDSINKLRKHSREGLVWGTSGDRETGSRFDQWMSNVEWPPDSWDTFSDKCANYLASLNGKLRERMRTAGVNEEEIKKSVIDVLVVSYFQTMHILELESDGKETNYNNFHAIGTGKIFAWVSYKTIEPINGTSIDKFKIITQVATKVTNDCDFPIHIWRLTKDGVIEIT